MTPVGGADEEEEPRRGSNGPPEEFTSLQEVFPGFKDHPGLGIPLAPIDGFFQISTVANATNAAVTEIHPEDDFLPANSRFFRRGWLETHRRSDRSADTGLGANNTYLIPRPAIPEASR